MKSLLLLTLLSCVNIQGCCFCKKSTVTERTLPGAPIAEQQNLNIIPGEPIAAAIAPHEISQFQMIMDRLRNNNRLVVPYRLR